MNMQFAKQEIELGQAPEAAAKPGFTSILRQGRQSGVPRTDGEWLGAERAGRAKLFLPTAL